jgi:hypothetical protein
MERRDVIRPEVDGPGYVSPLPETPATAEEVANQLARFLRANRRVEFCRRCLSVAFAVGDDVVEAAVVLLTRGREFRDDQWLCFRCRRTGSVIRAG